MKLQQILEARHHTQSDVFIVPITPQTEGDVSFGDWGFPVVSAGSGSFEQQIARAEAERYDDGTDWKEIYNWERSQFHGLKQNGQPSARGPARDRVHQVLLVSKEDYDKISDQTALKKRFPHIGYSDSETYDAQAWLQKEFTKAAVQVIDLSWPPLN